RMCRLLRSGRASLALPVSRRQLRGRIRGGHLGSAAAPTRAHRRRDPRGRHELGARAERGDMRVSERGRRSSSAVLIYVIVLMGMQVFLVTVAAEAFLADEDGLAWSTA